VVIRNPGTDSKIAYLEDIVAAMWRWIGLSGLEGHYFGFQLFHFSCFSVTGVEILETAIGIIGLSGSSNAAK